MNSLIITTAGDALTKALEPMSLARPAEMSLCLIDLLCVQIWTEIDVQTRSRTYAR